MSIARRMGGAGMRRGLRAPTSAASTVDPFARSDLGMLAGFDPDIAYLGLDGSTRASLIQARWSYDLAGAAVAAYSLSQGSSGARPLYEATGLLSKPSLYYVTDDFLSTADATLANLLDGTQPHTIYAVVDRDTASSNNSVCTLGDSASSTNVQIWGTATGAGIDQVYRQGVGSGIATGTQLPGTSAARMTVLYTPGTCQTWVASTLSANAAVTVSNTCDRVYLGAYRYSGAFGNFMNGRIGMVLIYRVAHDAAQRAYVWGLLQAHYSGLA